MSLVDCGSVDVSAVAPISVDLNKFSGIGDNPCEVKLQNESPLTLQINIGGDQHRLGAWTVDKFPLCGKTNFQVVPTQIQSPVPAVVPSNLLFVTVAPDGETIPGTFPAPLARMTTGTVILGSGSAIVGSINAVLSTVTVAGTINIGNTPAVTISGTPTVTISGTPTVNIGNTPAVTVSGTVSVSIAAGSVSITGQPVVNVQSANGVNVIGPSILASGMSGPLTGGWVPSSGNGTVAFNASGTLTWTSSGAGGNQGGVAVQIAIAGSFGPPKVTPGQTYYAEFSINALTNARSARLEILWNDAAGTFISAVDSAIVLEIVGTYVTVSLTAKAPPGAFFVRLWLQCDALAAAVNLDAFVIDHAIFANVGAFPINAQQSSLPVVTHVNVCDIEIVGLGAAGGGAFVDLAAVIGKSYVVQVATGALINVGPGVATGATFAVHDGLNLLPATALWASYTGVTATQGDKDRVHATDLGIIVPVGHATRIGFETGTAGISESVAAGVYLV